jgi:hypothetical protein
VRFRDESGEHEAQCRWFVDTSGRASVLQRARSLQRPANHATCAAWFRVDGVIDIDRWSSDEAWKSRNSGMGRLLSTNHLMGPGYWVWIIPLPEGRTSIGLVSDPEILPLDQFNTPEKFAAWARLHHPMLADALEEFSGPAMDFRYLPSLARDCKQFWSDDGWALSGDAGVFSDPFYSPGTDYIAIANSYITDFVTRGVDGKPGQPDVRFFHSVYRSFFASTISLYRQQYAGFGDSRLMALKSTWDYSYYWSVLAWMYMRGLLHDAEFLKQSQSELQDALALNNHMQALFRKRAESRKRIEPRGRFVDQQAIPILCELSAALRSSDTAPAVEIRENCIRLGALAVELEQILGSGDREGGSRQERAHSQLLGDLAGRLA